MGFIRILPLRGGGKGLSLTRSCFANRVWCETEKFASATATLNAGACLMNEARTQEGAACCSCGRHFQAVRMPGSFASFKLRSELELAAVPAQIDVA